jgi:Holliday junction resolvasome RuvABC endonuclease subunit
MDKTIIAIDPGTRYWGVSIFKGRDRVLSIVKTFSTKGSAKHRQQEAKLAFLSIFDKYVPDILVIEKPFVFWSKQSKLLNKIIEELKTSAKKKGMKVCEYSTKTVRKVVCNDEDASKKDLAKNICLVHPEMKAFFKQDKSSKDVYWGHVFDSVGLGICYLRILKYFN